MRIIPQADEVRRLVVRTFEDFGAATDSLGDLNETILIDDGRYRGRSYRAEEWMAMWLVEIGLLQFYDERGNMLLTINLFEEWEPQRMAA
ncbi:MAG TPA: hypothetical protein VHC19_13500 [Pirellulales bacterium]|jgi:hypothetical protein|nr:hypothetical protein [Pirellulales bacterium]